ncbi:FliM/FliN family flagellar motor switch protein [Dyella mobilis]|uniref:FliM/FliN family flagellar motor switch protein n=1 Tax=Dyella mobilis TaxID=1849582 RepID=A0ABS2KBE5_9GAMM|nr:FliM/FliN family flagellar motor switch protein [Dyella mobilis]MBM7128492.1 FliM/FliN family flagellar motor switch protein [Dyella mobilis]
MKVELAESLPCYPLCVELEGAVGALSVGIECAALYPEYSAELVRAACETEAVRIELIEWILMPWLDWLEARLGGALRISAVTLGRVMPPESVTLRLCAERGGQVQLAIAGSAMSWLAAAIRRAHPAPWSWMRVPLTAVLRVAAVSARELRALQSGAMVLLECPSPLFYLGHLRRRRLMTAQWNDETGGAVVRGQAHDAPAATPATEQLFELEELSFDIDVVLATRSLSLDEASALCPGAILDLERPVEGRHVTLACDGRVFARGTLAKVDERLAVLITESWGTRR